ncbi:hypothetical protein, partial [Streptomyces sp. NPDC096934]|uniref:hypothetical protein n=1 Tax=Streptomyces sp. NPDC096934 TaxID=3155551 RepID=UPI00332E4BD2
MPKKGNTSLKQKARRLAQCESIPYSEALALLTTQQVTAEPATRTAHLEHALTNFRAAVLEAAKPKFDFRAAVLEAAKPKFDFRAAVLEAAKPKFDFRA